LDAYDRLLLATGVFALVCFIGVSLYVRYHKRVMREEKLSGTNRVPLAEALIKIPGVGKDSDFDRRDDSC